MKTFRRPMVAASLIAVSTTLGTVAMANVRYRATNLRESGFAAATAVNNLGQVAGTSADRHLQLFDGQHVLDLGRGFDNVTLITPKAINDRAEIAGEVGFSDGRVRAFLYSSGQFRDLGVLQSGIESRASDVNNAGDVVGNVNPGERAFLYRGGTMSTLGQLGGSEKSVAAINDAGQVAATSSILSHAVILTSDGLLDLGALTPGGAGSGALDINDAGAVVGWSEATGGQRPFIYSAGRMIDLEASTAHPPGVYQATATAINNYGSVVGTAPGAFLWSGGRKIDLLPSNGGPVIPLAASSITPRAINDRGQILCDCFSESSGVSGPYLLTPVAGLVPVRLANVSIRAAARTGDETTILGFMLGGGMGESFAPMTGTVFMRAAGPALTSLGVPGAASDPRFAVFRGSAGIAGNDDWLAPAGAQERVGAFPFAQGSADAALWKDLFAGTYTTHVGVAPGDGGLVLAEIYDATASFSGPPPLHFHHLLNASARAFVGSGDGIAIFGFALSGSAPCRVLLRAVGPTLAGFGVGGVLADPRLWLHADGRPVMGNDDWGGAAGFPLLARTMADVGAFTLPDGSKDAALLLQLEPGAYTVHVSGADGGTGVALIELYLVP